MIVYAIIVWLLLCWLADSISEGIAMLLIVTWFVLLAGGY
jgi:hypothetical protein